MVKVSELLYDICEDEAVFDRDADLVERGLIDSFTVIELLSRLEDEGIVIQLTQIDRSKLRTVRGIEELIEHAQKRSE